MNENQIEQRLDQAIEERLLQIAAKNKAINIHNPDNFFNATKAVYNTKYDQLNNTYYYILRPIGISEPKLSTLKQIVDGKYKGEINFLFTTTIGYLNEKYVLGKLIENFDL